jgi:hypothetical protein
MSWFNNMTARAAGALQDMRGAVRGTEYEAGERENRLSSDPKGSAEPSEAEIEQALADEEQRFADYWGGSGPDYEAMEEAAAAAAGEHARTPQRRWLRKQHGRLRRKH